MKYKKEKIAVFFIFILLYLLFTSLWLFIIFAIGGVVVIFMLISLLFVNKLLKRTNWYQNYFCFTSQFISNAGYRDNLVRNYEAINLGSNPARFAFFYENAIGQNWSTGTQGLDMDLEVLKYFHSYIKKGGYVLIPIVPFSSISSYLKLENAPKSYIAKYVSILDGYQSSHLPNVQKVIRWKRFPLLYHPFAIRFLIRDVAKDRRLELADQMMESIDLIVDAEKWMRSWEKEFNINNLESSLNNSLQQCRNISVKNIQNIIDFCLERDLNPVLIFPPMTKYLSCKFTKKMREIYVYSFIQQANQKNIPFLDYWDDERFSDSSLYFNSFFLNLKGRKLFTKQVLEDLKINEYL